MGLEFKFEVIRKRFSVTQGEALVKCNGVDIVQYGDDIQSFDGEYRSVIPDEAFVRSVMREYRDEIMATVK